MIIICEPQCKGFSHEKFNSGFIYGLRLAFPEEKIIFFSHLSHIKAIQNILIHDNVVIGNIEYVPIRYGNPFSFTGIPMYYLVFSKVFSTALRMGTDKIFFLSYSPVILYVIKRLKQKSKFIKMKFTLVLHGGFESIAGMEQKPAGIALREKRIPNTSVLKRIGQARFGELFRKGVKILARSLNGPWKSVSERTFGEKEMLLWNHSSDFRYIALAPHVIENAAKYMDVNALNIYAVTLPTVFEKLMPQPENKYIRFAVFGYGDSLMLYNIAKILSGRSLKSNYEIRIIGMDSRGTEGFTRITCPSPGKGLDRADMKKYAQDIDVFLILYGQDRYRLSCSGSILESLSYSKPILHFRNDCINTFDTAQEPIGYTCSDLEEFVNKMQHMIENYGSYLPEFLKFRENIMKLRSKYSIENSSSEIKRSFTW